MLAKPEYFSPPDEVCCWPGRRSGAADRRCGGAFAGRGAAAKSHRDDIAGRGATAKLLTSQGAAAELLSGLYAVAKRRAEAPQWRRGMQGTPQWQRCYWQGRHGRVGGAGEEWQWQWNATADWQGNASGRLARECQRQTGTGTPSTQKSQLRQTELALLKPLVVPSGTNL